LPGPIWQVSTTEEAVGVKRRGRKEEEEEEKTRVHFSNNG